jgi:hypothetical protein
VDWLKTGRILGKRGVHAFHDDQHFFQAVLQSAGSDVDLLIGFARAGRRDFPDRQAFWKNTIVARGIEPLAGFDFLFVLHVVD